MKNLIRVLIVVSLASSSVDSIASSYLTKYCSSTVFRETPFADIRCANELSEAEAEKIKHFQFDYDESNRLVEVRYQLGNRLLPYSDRFVRASKTVIHYTENKEVRTYFNENGFPTLVSGDVHKSVFELDPNGQRRTLNFRGLNGEIIDNDFGISNYTWKLLDNGQVVETRKNIKGDIVRNRPGFGYMVTRFAFDANGLLTRMYNLGKNGKALTADEAGVAMTKIGYSSQAQFRQWLNLDLNGKPLKAMSAIAEIVYEPSSFRGEKEAYFFDESGQPQTTRWGAHRVSYEFDTFGNETQVNYYDEKGSPVESTSGIARVVSKWTDSGLTKLSDTYFDKHNNAVASSYSGVHKIKTEVDDKDRPKRHYFLNKEGGIQVHKGLGYAQEIYQYNPSGSIADRKFLNASGELVDHNVWKVALFKYSRDKSGNLISVKSYNAKGKELKSLWNPTH